MTQQSQATAQSSLSYASAAKWISSLHLAALALQVGLAIALLRGVDTLAMHSNIAWAVLGLGGVQAGVALFMPSQLIRMAAISVFALEGVQIWLGTSAQTQAHALNALLLWSLAITVTIRCWAAAPARGV